MPIENILRLKSQERVGNKQRGLRTAYKMNRKWIRAIILGVNVLRLKFVMRQKLLISFLWFDSKRYLQSFSGNLQYCSCLSRLHAQFLLFLNCNWYSIDLRVHSLTEKHKCRLFRKKWSAKCVSVKSTRRETI